jgi:hypothetical protein
MKAGQSGMFGGAIYFADSEACARHKALQGSDVIVTVQADLGLALVLESPANDMTLSRVRSYGCDTVKGRWSPRADWEYVVFEAHRITLISVEGKLPFFLPPPTLNTAPLTCTYSRHGTRYIAQPWFHCRTCGLVGDMGCCQGCYQQCHAGHDAYFEKTAEACYCDCGAGDKCQLTSKTTAGKCVCTYAQHGSQYILQPWYHCRTCELVGQLGCCQACFKLCHRGHDTFTGLVMHASYCNCGASQKCQCMKP